MFLAAKGRLERLKMRPQQYGLSSTRLEWPEAWRISGILTLQSFTAVKVNGTGRRGMDNMKFSKQKN